MKELSTNDADIQALRRFVVESSDLRKLEIALGRFNLFEMLQLASREIRHSNILAWLLDPEESHGLADLFLRRWLMRVFHASDREDASYLDPIDIDATPFTSVVIKREWNNLDLLVQITLDNQHQWVVCIENKIWSAQHSEQLKRYRDSVEREFSKADKLYILLSVLGEEPEDLSYVRTTYRDISVAIKECIQELQSAIPSDSLVVIQHYLKLIEDRFMPNSEVEQLALKIYASHKRALDIIFQHRPDTLQTITAGILERGEAIAKSQGLIFLSTYRGIVYFIPATWDVPANKRSETGHILYCEINVRNGLVLKAVAGPGNEAIRKGAFELSKAGKFPNPNARKELGKSYYQFYNERNPDISTDLLDSEIAEDIVPLLWEWVNGRIHDAAFTSMVDSVSKFLSSL